MRQTHGAAQITIVVPVHNRCRLVRRTLDSIAAQTHRPLCVVLVDNASTDTTAQVLRAWAQEHDSDGFRVTVIDCPVPGATNARNAGLRLVDTPWTMFFDSDDTMTPGHVARAAAAVEANPEADIIGWDIRLHGLDGSVVTKPFAARDTLYNCVMRGTMATQRYMVRTSVVRDAGGWNPDVMVWNDIELGTRLLLAGTRVVKVHGDPTVDVIATEASITGVDYSHNLGRRMQALRRIEGLDRRLRVIVAMKRMTLAALCERENPDEDTRRLLVQLRGEVEAADLGARHRLVSRWMYSYVKHGGRGASLLFRILI